MNEREIFAAALGKPAGDERRAFLDQICSGDVDLRNSVEALLAAHEQADDFLASKSGVFARTVVPERISEAPGTVIGPYRLLEQIGEGGFGVVFMAEQSQPVRRKVALKVIKPGMDTRQVIARFEAERQALALMDHPHIAKVYDAGTTESGRPYFVMELVRGIPITEFCDQHQLTVRERLELFVTVCQAAQHAHQKGIIHRDIKPSNVLVTLHDDRPVVKVIDFGVAKATSGRLTDKTLFTGFLQMLGTPLYMSPEQTALSGVDVDTRSDIYSLGVLLYELLTGTTPFDRQRFADAAVDEVRRIIREEEPKKPSSRLTTLNESLPSIAALRRIEPRKLSQLLHGDLDWIVMKALEKDRARRYETATGFAADVLRYLTDEPVTAVPPSAAYRFGKFARRNRVALAMIAVITAALLLGVVGTTWQAYDAMRQRDRAVKAEKDADEQRILAQQRADEADEARARAEASARQARQAVDDMYTQVAEKWLAYQPNLEPLQREFLEKVLRFYTEFAEQDVTDPAVRHEMARAYRRVADIQHRLGQRQESEEAFNRAIDQLQALADEFPATPVYRQELAEALHKLGVNIGDTGSPVEEARAHRRALALEQQLAAEFSDVPEYRQNLSRGYCYLARALNGAEEEQAFRSALTTQQSLVAEFPDVAEYRQQLADSHFGIGAIQCRMGRSQEGVQEILAAATLLETLVADFPAIPVYRNELACVYFRLGNYSPREELEVWMRKALPLQEKLATDFPAVTDYQFDLSRSLDCLGRFLLAHNRAAEAEQTLQRAVDIARKLVAESPTTLYYRSRLAESCIRLGQLLKSAGREQEANDLYRELRESLPDNADKLNGLAWNLATAPTEHERDTKWALEFAQKAVELAPQAGYIWNTLGVAHFRGGDWTAAITALEKSMEFRNGGDSGDWFFLAMAHWQLGEQDLARAWYTAARLWTNKYQPQNDELARFGAEAAALMGLPETDPMDIVDAVAVGDALVAVSPKASSYRFRGAAFANSEQWDRAADDFAKAIELGDKNFSTWYERALARLGNADEPGYQAACADMLTQFAQTENAVDAHFVAWSCALGPGALPDFTSAITLAETAANQDAASAQFVGGLGAILYRAGRFEEARQKLEEAERLSASAESSGTSPAYPRFFLAMTQYRLGNSDEAKQWFDKARQETDTVLKTHESGTAQIPWNRRLTLNLLRREAQSLLNLKEPSTGARSPEQQTVQAESPEQ